jgi:hypothetical protein
MNTEKPFGIKFISVFSIVLGFSILIFNAKNINRAQHLVSSYGSFGWALYVAYFLIGFLFVATGFGIWKLKKWAWYGETGLCGFITILQLEGTIWAFIARWPNPVKLEWQNLLVVFCVFSIWYLCRGKIWASFEPKHENDLTS